MTLTKHKMVSEIGRRTRLKNRDVQTVLETLIEVWTEELVEGSGRIELENFLVLQIKRLEVGVDASFLGSVDAPQRRIRVYLTTSKFLRRRLKASYRLHLE